MHQHLHFDMAISAASLRQHLLNSNHIAQRWSRVREIHCINGTLNASNTRYVVKLLDGAQARTISVSFSDEGPLLQEVWRGDDYHCQIVHQWQSSGWSLDAHWQLKGFRNRFANRHQRVLQSSLATGFNRLADQISQALLLEY